MSKAATNKFLVKTTVGFLIDSFIEKLKRDHPGYNLISCDNADRFISSVTEVSIFNESKNIVVLRSLDPDSLDAISAIINYETEDIWVILQKKKIPRTKAFTFIKGACQFVELKELDESKCAVWVRKWLVDLKLVFSEDIPSYIVSRVGTDISRLNNEVKKVAAYYAGSEDRVLTQMKCNEFFSEDTEARFFVIIENFFRKRVKEVFEEIGRVDEYSLVKLLHMMIGQAEKIYKVAIYKDQKMSAEDIGELLSVPKFVVTTKFFSFLTYYNKTKLIMLMDLFNELDAQLRLTKHSKSLLFECYLIKAMKL